MGKERIITTLVAIIVLFFLPAVSFAGEADVVAVKASSGKDGTWSFSVTVRHDDEGWDHYADRWEVLGLDEKVLGTRVLMHPHVGEQPFTRSLGGIEVPNDVSKVLVRARDSVHGYGGKMMEVELNPE